MPVQLLPLSEEARDALGFLSYLHGHCYAFAIGVHTITGWPVIVLDTSAEPDGHPMVHAGVRAPDGQCWDIRGPLPESTFAQPFTRQPNPVLQEVPPQALHQGQDWYFATRWQTAANVAEVRFPQLPLVPSARLPRLVRFLEDLEDLSRKKGVWITGNQHPDHLWPCLSEGDGSERGYVTQQGPDGTSWCIDRRLRSTRLHHKPPKKLRAFLGDISALSSNHQIWVRAPTPAYWPQLLQSPEPQRGYSLRPSLTAGDYSFTLTPP